MGIYAVWQCTTPYCILNIVKIKAGTLSFNLKETNEKLTQIGSGQKQYWNVYDYYNKPKLDLSFEKAKMETEKILVSA